MSQYLSRIEGSPPKRNAVGSIPIWDATRSKAFFAPFLCKKHPHDWGRGHIRGLFYAANPRLCLYSRLLQKTGHHKP